MEDKQKTIAIGADHAGYEFKDSVTHWLTRNGYEVLDFGTNSEASVDYPDHIHPVADAVESGEAIFGVILCGSGNGAAMTANKHQGIRAALCWNNEIAALARQHNNANILAIPARFVPEAVALSMVQTFWKRRLKAAGIKGEWIKSVAPDCMKLILIIPLLLSRIAVAQFDSTAYQLAQTIDAATLKTHIYALASNEFEGRETGTEGNQKAAAYIAAQFKADHIPVIPGDQDYFQEVNFTSIKWNNSRLIVRDELMETYKDYLAISYQFPIHPDSMFISAVTFVGYGINDAAYNDYKNMDVRGKHVLIYDGEPLTADGRSRITGTKDKSHWSDDISLKIKAAKAAGAASLWIVDDHLKDRISNFRRNFGSGDNLMGTPEQLLSDYIPNFYISSSLGQLMLGKKAKRISKLKNKIDKTGKPAHLTIPTKVNWYGFRQNKVLSGVNVLGFIEGTDPLLKNEVVVVSAHYDHLGKRGTEIYYGADDNASGTSAVLEIAQAMAIAKSQGIGPKRSVLCMLVTGEEKGLLGSQYYSTFPVFPIQNTVADVNIDMIGRMDVKHKEPNYTYVIGSDRLSTELHAINENANKTYTHLNLDYTYNADDDPNRFYYRSDHYNFAKKGIPAIFYFSGVHEDYHRPTDTPDKIMFEKAVPIAQLAFYTAWDLANRKDRIKVDVVGRN